VVDDYDFRATWRGLAEAPAALPVRPTRQLPLVGMTTPSAGSYGR